MLIEYLSFHSWSAGDYIILFHRIQFQEHFIVVIATAHDKGCFSKERRLTFHSGESGIVNGCETLFLEELRELMDWIVGLSNICYTDCK